MHLQSIGRLFRLRVHPLGLVRDLLAPVAVLAVVPALDRVPVREGEAALGLSRKKRS